MTSPLSGRRALVTGAASGIGAAIVDRLRCDGATVLATDIAPPPKDPLGLWAAHDVASEDDWRRVEALALERLGGLDILVNNAGVVSGQSIEAVSPGVWARTLAINLTGTMLGCQTAIRLMKQGPGPGAIVNVCSTTALAALPGDVAYTASKGGVRTLTRSVAVHCAQHGYLIRCNALIPGATDTAILKVLPDATRAHIAATSPLNRMADPAEMAAAVAFLASDECPFMTGAELLVDGGALAIHPGS
jgi:3(or 17)beta-hydroxysteroid dehydrogenase